MLALFKGNNSGTNFGKMTCNNPKLDHVNIIWINSVRILKILSGNQIMTDG